MEKTMETTAIIAAALVLGLASNSEPQPVFYGCETVDMGGYLNFADPTCPAQFTDTANYDEDGNSLDNK
jgi:hypothetical protein